MAEPKICRNCIHKNVCETCNTLNLKDALMIFDFKCKDFLSADVVARSEFDNLEYTLLGVMHSVDKWLDGDELEQDEVNRAAMMREKTLRIAEEKQAEIERLTINMNAFGLSAIREKERADTARAEVIKEFAERLKARIIEDFLEYNTDTTIGYIDNLVKEMLGEKNDGQDKG